MANNYDYHKDKTRLSKSSLCDLYFQSPLFYKWKHFSGEYEDEDTAATRFGTILHAAFFEPNTFGKRYPVGVTPASANQIRFAELMGGDGDILMAYLDAYPNAKGTNADKTSAEKLAVELSAFIQAQKQGGTIITSKEYDKAMRMVESMRRDAIVNELLQDGVAEEIHHFTDMETKTPCKTKPDWKSIKHGVLCDLKTIEDSGHESFQRQVAKYKYHLQPPFYCDGIYTATDGAENYLADEFIFIVVEKKPPFQLGLYVLDAEALELGREQYQAALNLHKTCMETGQWPGKNIGITRLALPRYFTNKFK